jgi:hypothetical protein
MILDLKKFKPILNFGIFLTATGCAAGIALIYGNMFHPKKIEGFNWFLVIMSLWHLLTGLLIILRKPLGYTLMRFYLHIFKWGWPIGTTIARSTFLYIEENNIKEYFVRRSISI